VAEPKLFSVPLSALLPDSENANSGTERGREVLAHSIEEFGMGRSVVTDAQDRIIGGNKTWEAATAHGVQTALIVETDGDQLIVHRRRDLDLDEPKARQLAYFDNRSSELNLAWSLEQLTADLKAGIDLSPAWNAEEVAAILAQPPDGLRDGADPDAVPEDVPTRVQPGEYWSLGQHRLLCGDSTDAEAVGKLLGGRVPALMVTDPPYGVDLDPTWRDDAGAKRLAPAEPSYPSGDTRSDWREAYALSGAPVAYVWHADRFSSVTWDGLVSCGYDVKQQIIWVKNVHTLSRTSYHFKHEPCWYPVKKGKTIPWFGSYDQMTVWEAAPPRHIMSGSKEERFDHPCQKPVALYTRPIENHTRPADLVYDAFLGSGTALIAAEHTGRACYGVELDPGYCSIILKRWEDATGKQAERID
jgi:DNA modification methylase